ncbi:hypothetical protein V491_08054, partial [Pseudogymnoascus sp. VKM F-3775]
HYITEDRCLQESVLALYELKGSHSAKNQAEVIIEVIKDYGFASKLGNIMSDNATVNDKMMEDIAILPSKEEIEKWRKKGPLGKLYNIAVYIQRSPQRLAEFEKYSNGKRIPRDNSMRWNSWYHMIDAAIDETMRPAIIHFCTKYDDLSEQFLSYYNWQILSTFHRFLKYFDIATGKTQGYYATVDRVLPTMEYILEKLEADRSITYTASVVLNPTQKWQAFSELQWSDEWITAAWKQVLDL